MPRTKSNLKKRVFTTMLDFMNDHSFFHYFFLLIAIMLTSGDTYALIATNDSVKDSRPTFEGGKEKLEDFIDHYLIYPQDAFNDSVGGAVMVGFTVNKKGALQDIKILKPISRSLDSEAIRVVRLMSQVLPKWTPGKLDGKNISMEDSIPVVFNVSAYELSHHVQHTDKTPSPGYDINKYVADNLIYPKNDREKNVQGTVLVRFLVSEDGSLSDFKVVKHVEPELDVEALRIIRKMPKWNPAIQHHQTVRSYFTIPVRFSLP